MEKVLSEYLWELIKYDGQDKNSWQEDYYVHGVGIIWTEEVT